MLIWFCVVIRILANPLSNVFQKILTRKNANPLLIVCVTHGLLSLVCLPTLLFFLPPLSTEFWWTMAGCTLLTVSGNALLIHAMKLSDLSVLGPINAYKSVVSLVPSMILLHEFPGTMGLSGIVLIVAGSYGILDTEGTEPGQNSFVRFFKDRGVQYRFAALILSAIEAVFLKKALLASSALATFGFWSVLGFGVSFAVVVVTMRRETMRLQMAIVRETWLTYGLLFATTGLMQLSTILILEGLQVGYALALFQTSALLSVILGHRLFQEQHFFKRLTGAAVMVAGAVLIILGR